MFQRFSNSWQLVKASWAVLRSDKELILFPIISSIVLVIITIVLLVPSAIVMFSLSASGAGEETFNVVGMIGLFIFYLVSYTITIYFNTGLVGAAMIRLDGGDPTVRDGFRIANERIGKIIGYAAISATVGTILRIIEERSGIIGQIVAGIIGMVWNMATFLVIPVLVAQDLGPIESVKYSAELLKKTWGEQIAGNFSVGAIFALFYFALIGIGIFLVIGLSSLTGSGLLAVIMICVVVLTVLILATIQGALSGIFQAALYRFAETGVAPDNFDIELIQGAFRPKNKRKLG